MSKVSEHAEGAPELINDLMTNLLACSSGSQALRDRVIEFTKTSHCPDATYEFYFNLS